MTLREDSDFYCLLWIGMILMGSYYFNIVYLSLTQMNYLSNVLVVLPSIIVVPLVLIILLVGYLRPSRGRIKANMLALAVVVVVLFYAIPVVYLPAEPIGGLYLVCWGVSASLLVAGSLSIRVSAAQSTMEPMLDVTSLRYPPSSGESAESSEISDS